MQTQCVTPAFKEVAKDGISVGVVRSITIDGVEMVVEHDMKLWANVPGCEMPDGSHQ